MVATLSLTQIDFSGGASHRFRPSYFHLEAYQTRIRCLIRRGLWAEASDLGAEAVAVADSRGDRLLGSLFRVLKAEALLMLGEFEQAGALVAEASLASTGASLVTHGQIERVKGKALSRLGRLSDARVHFERALRIWTVGENACLRMDVEADYREAIATSHGLSPADDGSGAQHIGEPPDRTEPIGVDPDVHARPAGAPAPEPVAVLQTASAMFDLAAYPELLGHEAFAVLRDSSATLGVALTATRSGNGLEVLASAGKDTGGAKSGSTLPTTDMVDTIDLGTSRGRDIRLSIESAPDMESRQTVVAVRKLVEAAVATEHLTQEARRRASLWPVEPARESSNEVWASIGSLNKLELAQRLAPTGLPLLLTGETGTGKEVLARVIHRSSNRSGAFVPYNCSAVPRDMLESQLFGCRKGAFTGAHDHSPGVIRAAAGGTLFLDEVGDLSLDIQPKLLRFLETREIHPLGEPQPLTIDVRVIAATNAEIEQLVADGRFREDLFYRLNVARIPVLALRDRREEIPALAHHFLGRYAAELNKGALRLSDEALEYLVLHRWPGNVRELANELRVAAALAERDAVLSPENLSPELRASRRTLPAADPDDGATTSIVRTDQTLPAAIQSLERAMVTRALEVTGSRVEQAAKLLGISRKGLYLKRRQLGLDSGSAASLADRGEGEPLGAKRRDE